MHLDSAWTEGTHAAARWFFSDGCAFRPAQVLAQRTKYGAQCVIVLMTDMENEYRNRPDDTGVSSNR